MADNEQAGCYSLCPQAILPSFSYPVSLTPSPSLSCTNKQTFSNRQYTHINRNTYVTNAHSNMTLFSMKSFQGTVSYKPTNHLSWQMYEMTKKIEAVCFCLLGRITIVGIPMFLRFLHTVPMLNTQRVGTP